MAELLNGILLRRIRYSDTSLILTWFTDLHGKVKAMAKGALRQGSAFAGKLDLFFHCDLLLSFSRKTELHLLREVSIKTTYERIRTNYLKTSAASYFVELVEEVTELDHPAPEIYRLLVRALGYLDRQNPDTRGVLFFESELCKCLGLYTPNMHSAADKLVETYGHLPKTRAILLTQL
jgi:DNA repair protein RecO (recombination protein O)